MEYCAACQKGDCDNCWYECSCCHPFTVQISGAARLAALMKLYNLEPAKPSWEKNLLAVPSYAGGYGAVYELRPGAYVTIYPSLPGCNN